MKKKIFTAIAVLAIVALISGASILAVASPATNSDPLITLSYLNGPFRNLIFQDINAAWNSIFTRIGDAENRITDELNQARSQNAAAFSLRTINNGSSQNYAAGSEIMLQSGSATFSGNLAKYSGTPSSASSGSLVAYNMYVATGSVTITATGGNARVWVRAAP